MDDTIKNSYEDLTENIEQDLYEGAENLDDDFSENNSNDPMAGAYPID